MRASNNNSFDDNKEKEQTKPLLWGYVDRRTEFFSFHIRSFAYLSIASSSIDDALYNKFIFFIFSVLRGVCINIFRWFFFSLVFAAHFFFSSLYEFSRISLCSHRECICELSPNEKLREKKDTENS